MIAKAEGLSVRCLVALGRSGQIGSCFNPSVPPWDHRPQHGDDLSFIRV